MRPRVRAALLFFGVTIAALGRIHAVRADQESRGHEVVATVGTTEITASALEQRLKSIPDFQLATFGKTPNEQKRNFLEQVVVKEVLLAEGAKAQKLDETPEARERAEAALRGARLNLLKEELAVTPGEVTAFYVENHDRFDSPERIAIYRILCLTREEAASVIVEAKRDTTLAHWNELARERSIDKATSLRGGNLGFLAADGTSSEPSVRVDPALFAAAARAKDGELVSEPVKEGYAFAVVWRRGTVPAMHHSIEEETTAIRQILVRKKLEDGTRALLKQLRADRNVQEQPHLIDLVDVDSSGAVLQRKRPGVVPRKVATPPLPIMTPSGLR
jgi:peptidyl-prolyl cis-trans isomerase C